MTDKPHNDPFLHAITVEGARLALLQAGPHSGLIGPAAACMDGKLNDVRDYLNEIADRVRARREREAGR